MKISLLILLSLIPAIDSYAGSATWNAVPTSDSWSNTSNWTPSTVPKDPADTATFGTSSITTLHYASLTVGSIVYNPGASAYTINPYDVYKSTMSGPGIINNSGVMQTINLPSVPTGAGHEEWGDNLFMLAGSATAGEMVQYNVFGSSGWDCKTDDAAVVEFQDTTTAGSATFVCYPGGGGKICNGLAGSVTFYDSSSAERATFVNKDGELRTSEFSNRLSHTSFAENSTAADATITNEGGAHADRLGGWTEFYDQASAGNATVINNGGSAPGALPGETAFYETATAANGTLIANDGVGEGGRILFSSYDTQVPSGGTARIEVFGKGNLDLSGLAPGLTTGSLEGDGIVFLGSNNLTIGTNNLSTLFSGVIQDGGVNHGNRGSLTKIGEGKLTLTSANAYTGGTVIDGGIVLVNNTSGSGLGSGPVQVTTGILGGIGTISNTVTIGSGHDTGASLGPGQNSVIPGMLTIQRQLRLEADGTYRVTMNSNTPAADQVIAKGVRIDGAQIVLLEGANAVLPPGTTFTVINNTAVSPIRGTFANLPDGGLITAGLNTYQASYEGDDGNDFTLTVVP